MASSFSIGNLLHPPVLHRPRFSSSLYLSSKNSNLLLFKNHSSVVSSSTRRLSFSPLPKNTTSTDFTLKVSSRFSGFSSLLKQQHHRSSEFPIVSVSASEDADDREIEASNSLAKPSKSFSEKYPTLVTGLIR